MSGAGPPAALAVAACAARRSVMLKPPRASIPSRRNSRRRIGPAQLCDNIAFSVGKLLLENCWILRVPERTRNGATIFPGGGTPRSVRPLMPRRETRVAADPPYDRKKRGWSEYEDWADAAFGWDPRADSRLPQGDDRSEVAVFQAVALIDLTGCCDKEGSGDDIEKTAFKIGRCGVDERAMAGCHRFVLHDLGLGFLSPRVISMKPDGEMREGFKARSKRAGVIRPALEALERRDLLAAAVLDSAVVLDSVTTLDSRGVTIEYDVLNADQGQPFELGVYRSADDRFDSADLTVATLTVGGQGTPSLMTRGHPRWRRGAHRLTLRFPKGYRLLLRIRMYLPLRIRPALRAKRVRGRTQWRSESI